MAVQNCSVRGWCPRRPLFLIEHQVCWAIAILDAGVASFSARVAAPIASCFFLTSVSRALFPYVIQPKDLYRKLAALLAEINKGRNEANYLLSVVARLETSFIRDLHITKGHLYAEDQAEFIPIRASLDENSQLPARELALDPEAVELVRKNGVYIYNDPSLAVRKQFGDSGADTVPAAFVVKNPSRHWIFVFLLEAG